MPLRPDDCDTSSAGIDTSPNSNLIGAVVAGLYSIGSYLKNFGVR